MARLGRDVKLKARLSLEEQFRRILRFPLDNRELTRLASILPSITRITDPSDSSEIAVKYRLTVKELMRFILKFEQGKMRELELKRKKVKSEVDTDEEEGKDPINMADVIKLRHKRLLRRNRKYGKIIKVHFYQGITLVIDPVSKARIETKR
ncbi:DEKNAAC101278 [Brettanomyces naardenensis]|uniref:DEKNAAC101278 n=1 Tax=Brettanomyces naardenensis TaxID=13370 RepID=A0A448YHT5_BRENA|nr:DEKNAAC101278 [Brettanomyces naardenensis]